MYRFRFHHVFDSNPILRAELAHQQGQIDAYRRRQLIRLLYAVLLIFSLAAVLITITDFRVDNLLALFFDNTTYARWTLTAIVLNAIIAVHIATVFRTLVFGTNAIVREKRSRTWETLLLTNVDARQLVIGKWWATVRRVWASYLWLVPLRIGAVVWLGAQMNLVLIGLGSPVTISPPPVDISNLLVAVLLITALTLVNALFTAAYGVLGSLLNRVDTIGPAMATFTRMLTLVGMAVLLVIVGFTLFFNAGGTQEADTIPLLLALIGLTFIDNGSLAAAALLSPLDPNNYLYLLALLVALVAYGLITILVLRLAQAVAVWQRVLPPDGP